MRCLWITRQDPRPSDSGELIYTRGLLRALSAHPGFKVTVLAHRAATTPDEPPDSKLRWELHGWIPKGRLGGLFSGLPSDAWRLYRLARATTDPEVRAVFDRFADTVLASISLNQLGTADPPPLARAALVGFFAFFEAALEEARAAALPRERVLAMLNETLVAALRASGA